MKIPALAFISSLTYLIPAIAGIWRFKRLERPMKMFLLLCVWSCIEATAEYILGMKHINNSFLINYYFLIDSLFLSVVYSYSIEDKRTKRTILVLAILFIVIWVIDRLFFAVPGQMNNEMAATSSIFIIIVSILIVLVVIKKTDRLLIDEPIFWVSTGYALYSAGVLLIFGLSNELLKLGMLYFAVAWHINWSLAIVANLMFTRGFFCRAKQQI
jgi:hypothetical protein